MSLIKSLKTFISGRMTGTTYAAAPISFGARAQDTALPAITYQVLSDSPITIGPTRTGFASVEINFINLKAQDAVDMAEEFTDNLTDSGTYDTVIYQAILDKHFVLQEPIIGNSEEAEPFICSVSLEIYYTRT